MGGFWHFAEVTDLRRSCGRVAVPAGSFKTWARALEAADLVDALEGEEPSTVFAPTDDAFGKLPAGTVEGLLKPQKKADLRGILEYHVVAGKVLAADVVEMDSAETLQGRKLAIQVREGTVMVDKATVTKTDVECSNGVIHVIDGVVLP
jgi:transforming growth factor-beta-induced protein